MKILAVGAHPDDIELYCGGALLRAIARGDEVRCIICTRGESQDSTNKLNGSRMREQEKAWKFMGVKDYYVLNFRDGSLEHSEPLINKLDEIMKEYKPDTVYSHSEHDTHQDHIAVAKCIRSTNRSWRFQWLTYCSYDLRNSFQPNFFIGLDAFFKKKKQLLRIFKSQKARWYFRDDVLISRSLGTNVGKYVEPFRLEFGFMK